MKVYTTYDTAFCTWNVLSDEDNTCLFYGDIEGLQDFLKNHPEYEDVTYELRYD